MAKMMNKCFQMVFTEEGVFDLEDGDLDGNILTGIEVGQEEVMRLLESLDENKAPGPDGISN